MKIRYAAVVAASFALPSSAFAGASFLGFSAGEDTMTLSAILAQAIQQVAILKDVAAITRDVKENVSFVKDVYGTANDVANARWEKLAEDFVGELLDADPNLREIYRNSEDVLTDRVPRGNRFRALIGAGFNQIVYEAFGPYPLGPRGDQYALSDYRAMNLNAVADEQMDALRRRNAAKRIERAWDDCGGNLEECARAGARMQVQTAKTMEDLKALQAEQARAFAAQMAIENAERKQREAGSQRDLEDISKAANKLSERSTTATYGEEKFK